MTNMEEPSAFRENKSLDTEQVEKTPQTGENDLVNNDFQNTGYSRNGIVNNTHSDLKTSDIGCEETSGFKFFTTLSGQRKYTLLLITLAQCLASVAISILGPFFPIEAKKKGMDMGNIGVLFGLFSLVIFVTAPFFGSYLVKLGPRFVLTAGIFVGGCCNILFGTLEYCPDGTSFVVMCFIVRGVEAVGFSAFITSSLAIVTSEFKENIGLCFGIVETGSGVGFLVGPMLGGALFELGGFSLPFYFAGVATLLNGMAVYKCLPLVDELPSKPRGSVLILLRSPMVVVPLGSIFVGMMSTIAFDSTFATHFQPLGLTVGVIGMLYGAVSISYTIVSPFWGYLTDSKDIQAPLIVGGDLVFGLAFLIMAPSVLFPFLQFGLVTTLVGLALLGVSMGCMWVPTMKCMVIGATELGFENSLHTYALVSGLFNSAMTLGGFIGPVIVGRLVEEFDSRFAYTVLGLCSIFMMFVSAIFFTSRALRRRRIRAYENIDKIESAAWSSSGKS